LYKNKDKDLVANGTILRSLAVLLNFNFVFNLFCLVYCGLFPVLNKFISSFSRLVKKTSLPIVPLWMGIFFVVVVIGSEVIEILVASELEITAFEMKETNLAFLFMITAHYFAKNLRKRSESSSSLLKETGQGGPQKKQSDINEFEADLGFQT
jgi:hypothetical protein